MSLADASPDGPVDSPVGGAVEVVDPRLMRDVMGAFATGVTIVTATTEDGAVGFTCQSFSSLSLDPPLVVFAPARSSTTWPRLRALGRFCINVLAEDQTELSATFAGPSADRFAGVPWHRSRQGQPVLDGVVAWIDCALWAEYDGGDHTLVAARVLDLGADPVRRPLLFHRGSYGLLGDGLRGGGTGA